MHTSEQTFTCEIFRNENQTAGVFLDDANQISSGWFLDNNGILILSSVESEPVPDDFFQELSAQITQQ